MEAWLIPWTGLSQRGNIYCAGSHLLFSSRQGPILRQRRYPQMVYSVPVLGHPRSVGSKLFTATASALARKAACLADKSVEIDSMRVQSQLVLMRHGESMWNDLKLFTGDVDIPLTEKGVMEALAGGRAICEIDFNIIFTSRLVRAKQTALIAMTQSKFKQVPVLIRGGFYGKGKTGDENRLKLRDAAARALEHASCQMVPVYADPALNERCYGLLQGLSKDAAAREFGTETVKKWRRSYDTRPPNGESLQDTGKRTIEFFEQTIEPRLKEGRNVLVVSHGNVLRCIISHLSGLTDMEMLRLQIHTALPYAYAYDGSLFAQCCIMPPIDPKTNHVSEGVPQGMTSVLKKGEIDSLI